MSSLRAYASILTRGLTLVVLSHLPQRLPLHAQTGATTTAYRISTVAGNFDPTDGPNAQAVSLYDPMSVAADANGNLYIADTSNNRIRRLSRDGVLRTIAGTGTNGYRGDGGAAASAWLSRPRGIALDSDGNLYIADTGNNRVRKITPDGVIRTVAGNGQYTFSGDGGAATAAGLRSPSGVAIEASGAIYVADSSNHRVRRIGVDGIIATIAGNGTPGFSGDGGAGKSAALNYPNGLAVDSSGNVYIADSYNHRIRRVSEDGVIRTFAGTGGTELLGDGGAATAAALYYPWDVAVEANGNVYIADSSHSRIRRVAPDGVIRTVAGNGNFSFSGDAGPATSASLNVPCGIALDGNRTLYIADYSNHRIRKVGTDAIMQTVAGNGNVGFSGDGRAGSGTSLYLPMGAAVDSSGSVYIADTYNQRVRKVTPDGVIRTVAGSGNYGFRGDGQAATSAWLAYPRGIAVDSSGNLFIADTSNHRVRKVTPEGVISTVAGNGTGGFSGDGGAATSASLNNPVSVTVDSGGNLYIADYTNHRIRKVSRDGMISTLAGNGDGKFAGDGGAATSASVYYPSDVAVDRSGNVFIADYFNARIRRVSADGIIRTAAGSASVGFSGDNGAATSAGLYYPAGIAVDGAGNLYITDTYSQRIRKVTTDGIIRTVAGNGTEGFGGDGGAALSASMNSPFRSAVDASGNIYVADADNHRVRKLTPQGTINVCAFSLSPTTLSVEAAGGTRSVTVTTTAACQWSASSGSTFLSIASGAAGSGSGTVTVSIAANTSTTQRTGTLTIAGLSLSVTQAGASGSNSSTSLDYTISTVAGSFDPNDGSTALDTGLYAPYQTAVDGSGNLFIADRQNNRVRKVTPDGAILTVAGTGTSGYRGDNGAASSAWLSSPSDVAVDSQGNLFIADTSNQRIRRVTADGVIRTIAGNGSTGFGGDRGAATSASLNSPYGVALDARGNLYIADTNNHRIRRVGSDGVIVTVAGNGTAGFSGDGEAATAASLNFPSNVAIDSAGNLYIADRANHRIRKVTSDGRITTVAGDGTGRFRGDGGPATAASLSSPRGISVDGKGTLFIADSFNYRIRAVSAGGVISTVAGNGIGRFSGDGGPASSASVWSPYGVMAANDGSLFISDTFNDRIRKVSTDGIIQTVAGNGSVGYSGDGGAATAAAFRWPWGVTVDSAENLYIADTENHRIRRVAAGTVTTVAGTGTAGFRGDGAPASSAWLYLPYRSVVDSSGNLYISDTENNRIRKVSADGSIRTIAGTGVAGFSGDGGPATSAELNSPYGLVFDKAGALIFADRDNQRVRKITTDGIIQTIAGSGTAGFSGDAGYPASARLNGPRGVALDASGNLYIADTNNNRIRKVSADGLIRTFAGDGVLRFAGDGGQATAASLYAPYGVAVDDSGNVFIADRNNHRVRRVRPDGIITTIAGNGTSGFGGDGGAATAALLNAPSDVAVGSSGAIYVVDNLNHRIRKLGPRVTVSSCQFSLSASSINVDASGGTRSVSVATASNCTWSAVSNASFVTVTAGASGTGSRAVNFTVAPNTSTAQRTGSLTLAGLTFTVIQAGAVAPALSTTPARMSFSVVSGGQPETQTLLLVANTGSIPFSITTSSTGGTWLRVSPVIGSTPTNIAVSVNPTGLAAGTYTGTITAVGSGAGQSLVSSITVPVTVTVTPAPRPNLLLDPLRFSFSYQMGGEVPAPASLAISSSGAALNYTISTATSDGRNWLSSSPGGTTNGSASISVNPAGLSSGTYSGTVIVTSANAANSPQQVPVTLTVLSVVITNNLIASPRNGLDFQYQLDGPQPSTQNILVASSGDAIDVTASASSPGPVRWLDVTPKQARTNADLVVIVSPAGLSPGRYAGSISITGAGQTAEIPVRLSVTQRVRSNLKTDTPALTWSTPSGTPPEPRQIRVSNEGTERLEFEVKTVTDDGGTWLSSSKTRAAADWQTAATLVFQADPTGLPPDTYHGTVELRAPDRDPIVIPVALVVSARKKLVLSQQSLSFTATANGSSLPQAIGLVSLGGSVSWTARVVEGGNWINLVQRSGVIAGGRANRVEVQVTVPPNFSSEMHGMIEFDSPDVDNRPEKVAVVLLVKPDRYLPPTAIPSGVSFASQAGSNPEAQPVSILWQGAPSNVSWNAEPRLDPASPPNTPAWLSVEPKSGRFTGLFGTQADMTLRANIAGLTPGVPYRATVNVIISGNISRDIPVLLLVAPAGTEPAGKATSRNAACVPSTYLPLFTSLEQNFSVLNGQTSATELIVVDNCGNPVTNAAVGAELSTGDRPFNLVSLGDGRWRAAWVPRGALGGVTMSVVASNGEIDGMAPTINGVVSGAIKGPVLDAARPILTADGKPLVAVAPGSLIRIQGSNLASTSGPTTVTIGDSELIVQFVSGNQIIAVVPEDLPTNRNLPLVVRAGDYFSVPESVLVASTAAVALSASALADGTYTMDATGVARLRRGDIIKSPYGPLVVDSSKRLSPGIYRVTGRAASAAKPVR